MISIHLTTYAASPPETVVPKNPVPPQKKEQRSMVRRVILGRNRSPARKFSANTADTRSVSGRSNTSEISRELGARVTTTHMFWPNQRRKAALSLPSWLRNSDVLGGGYDQRAERGAGGSAARSRQKTSTEKLARNFMANGSPALFCGFKKERRPATATRTSALPANTVP